MSWGDMAPLTLVTTLVIYTRQVQQVIKNGSYEHVLREFP